MVLIVTMDNNYAMTEVPFVVNILDCMLTDVEVDATQPIELIYTFQGPKEEALPNIIPTPDYCMVGYTFEGPFKSGTDETISFGFIDGGNLVIYTVDDSLHDMTEPIDIKFTPNGSGHSTGTGIISYEITFDACGMNTFTVDQPIGDFEYTIDSGAIEKKGSFKSKFTGCESP